MKDNCVGVDEITGIEGSLAVFVLDRLPIGFISPWIGGLKWEILRGSEYK